MITETELFLLLTRFADALDTPVPIQTPATFDPSHAPPQTLRRACRRRIGDGPHRGSPRHPYLSAEHVESLYEATSFLGQETGLLLNVRAEIDHGAGRSGGGAAASDATADFTRRARHILERRGQPDFPFLYVHELDPHRGQITRLAAHVSPGRCLEAFTVWAQEKFITTGRRIAPKVRIDACSAAARPDRVAFHARSLQQLLRGVDPNILDFDEAGLRRPLVDLLAVPAFERHSIGPIASAQRFGTSDSLGPGERLRAAADGMGFLSALRDRAWSWLYSGWEIDEHRRRLAERATRDAARARMDALWPDGPNALVRARRAAEQEQLAARCSQPADLMARPWTG